jgi:hypothetical protein
MGITSISQQLRLLLLLLLPIMHAGCLYEYSRVITAVPTLLRTSPSNVVPAKELRVSVSAGEMVRGCSVQ